MSSSYDFSTEVWIKILYNLTWRELLSTITRVNKNLRMIVKSQEWEDQKVIINSSKIAKRFIKYNKFVNYEFNCKLSNYSLSHLAHCDKITLKTLDGISEEGLKQLSGCKKVKVDDYYSVRISHQPYLTHLEIREEDFWSEYFEGFTFCEKLTLYKCIQVEYSGLDHLVNLKRIELNDCSEIKIVLRQLDECKNLNEVYIFHRKMMLDEDDAKHFERYHHVTLRGDIECTRKALKSLSKCQSLNISLCQRVRIEEVKYLSRCKRLRLSALEVSNGGLKYLERCGSLEILSDGRTYIYLDPDFRTCISLRYSSH